MVPTLKEEGAAKSAANAAGGAVTGGASEGAGAALGGGAAVGGALASGATVSAPIDFSKVEIEPIFEDAVDFETFCAR